jgi:protein involved in polysaccharide export with SLBB domain
LGKVESNFGNKGGKLMRLRKIFFVFVTLSIFLTASCASEQRMVRSSPGVTQIGPKEIAEYVIQAGDELDIKFFYNPELNETVTVRPDGKISLQLVDEIHAAGHTPAQLDEILTNEYARELKKPAITVIVQSFTGQRVYVGGEVNRPGEIDLTNHMSALQAVIDAGGFKETAKPEAAIIIRKGVDNRPIPMRVDLEEVFTGNDAGGDFKLKPYDIVYVPKSAIAKANKWVNQYIEELLLFRGVSMGFSYRLDDWDDDR